MSSRSNNSVLVVAGLCAIMLLGAAESAPASDLASRANIFMYSRPMPVAPLVLRSPAGKTVNLGDFRGRVVLLRFSSVNCPACRYEEPMLDELKRVYGPAGLEIVGVNMVDSAQEIAQHSAATNSSIPTFMDGGGFSLKPVEFGGKRTAYVMNPMGEAILEVPGFPTTYILDCSGLAVGKSFGAARWTDGSAKALIDSLVKDNRACRARPSVFRSGKM